MKKLMTFVLFLAVACALIGAQEQKEAPAAAYLDSYIEMARSDLRTQKTAIITQAVPFTEKESAAFWPVYRKYDLELSNLSDERLGLIKDYAAGYQTMTDAKAKELADWMLASEEKRLKLKKKYFAEFDKILPATKAARLLQVETRIGLLIDLQIAANVPMIEKAN